MRSKSLALLSLATILGFTLAGCSAPSAPAGSRSDQISVVAATSVYGDIAKQIGGSHVKVTSVITDPTQDPHSYQADAQVQLALSKAHIVVQNGGGYDDFLTSLLASAKNSDVVVVNVTTLSGYDTHPASGEFNEHLWYDFATMQTLVAKLVKTFSTVTPAASKEFAANGAAFDARLATLEADEASLKSRFSGEGVAITEPVPLYLLTASGLSNKTPAQFSKAIEAGTDVSPLVLQQTIKLLSGKKVKLLAYNEQTSGAETTQIIAAAKSANIPIVGFTETLPAAKSYLGWMTENLAAVKAALTQ